MVRFESGTFDTLIRLVDAGFGLTVLPELVVRSLPSKKRSARVRRFVSPVPTREVGFVRARDDLHRRIADALIANVAEAVPGDLAPAVTSDAGTLPSPR